MLGVAIGLVGRLKNSVSPYAVLGYSPGLVLDFTNEYYRTGGALTTFDSALTATRAGNATMVDSDGKIKWAPHNLQLYSGTIQSGLSFTGATALSSLEFAEDGSTGSHFYRGLGFNGYKAGEKYTLQFSVKQGTGNRYLQVTSGNANVWPNAVLLDPTNGLFISSQPQDIITVDPEDPTYWRVSITRTIGITAGTQFDYRLYDKDLGTITYTGDNASSMLITRFALYRSDLGGMVNNPDRGDSYVPTTSAARYLPRRGHHVYNGSEWVNEGLLVESEARTNLVTYSENFTNASWVNQNSTDNSSAITGPDGLASASSLNESATTATHTIYWTGAAVAANWTASVYIKQKSAGRYLQIRPYGIGSGIAWATFDPADGSLYESGGTNLVSTTSENIGNGWYRVAITCSSALIDVADGVQFALTNGNNGETPVYTGDGTSGIYIYGAQLEAGSTPSSYIPTAGATVTRAAETLVIPSANLPWPAPQYVTGTELVTNGTFDTDTAWTKPTGWSIGSGVASYGGTGAQYSKLFQVLSLTLGKVYAITFTLSGLSGSSINFGLGNAAGTAFGVGAFKTVSQNGTYSEVFVHPYADASFMVQNNSATQTFSIDNISVKEINPLSVSIAMDGRMTYADTGTTATVLPVRWDAGGSVYIQSRVDTASTDVGRVVFAQQTGGVYDSRSVEVFTPGINVPFNIASRHGSTFINGAVDGVALTADLTPVALPDLSATDLQLGYDFMGTIGSFRIWADDIGDAGLVTATNPSTEPSLLLTFDSAETSFVDLGWRN